MPWGEPYYWGTTSATMSNVYTIGMTTTAQPIGWNGSTVRPH